MSYKKIDIHKILTESEFFEVYPEARQIKYTEFKYNPFIDYEEIYELRKVKKTKIKIITFNSNVMFGDTKRKKVEYEEEIYVRKELYDKIERKLIEDTLSGIEKEHAITLFDKDKEINKDQFDRNISCNKRTIKEITPLINKNIVEPYLKSVRLQISKHTYESLIKQEKKDIESITPAIKKIADKYKQFKLQKELYSKNPSFGLGIGRIWKKTHVPFFRRYRYFTRSTINHGYDRIEVNLHEYFSVSETYVYELLKFIFTKLGYQVKETEHLINYRERSPIMPNFPKNPSGEDTTGFIHYEFIPSK